MCCEPGPCGWVQPGVNPLQLGASSVFRNALEEAQVQLSVSSCLPAHLCKPARSFTYGLSVKALQLRAITKASVETRALAELGRKNVCSRTRYRSRRKRCASRGPGAPAARPRGECRRPRWHC